MKPPIRSKTSVLASVSLAFLAGLGMASSLDWPNGTETARAQVAAPASQQIREASELSDAFVAIADAVTPGVVRIQAERRGGGARAQQQLPPGFHRFFDQPDGDEQDDEPQIAGGSGLIVDSDGYILTNNHVVAAADRIWVTLMDKRTFEAEVVGRDPTTDLAVIRVDADALPTVPLGDSDGLRVGEWVLAIGNPGFNDASTLDFTVTSGIVSAKGRPLDIIHQELALRRNPAANYAIEDFIQTDAVINPGNSGGPLVNLQGEVVGLNTAIASGTGFYQGYGFAIPVNLARWVTEDLIEHGRVRRALLGITIRNVEAEDAATYGLPDVSGVLIQDFSEGSPAQETGLDRHDVIVAVGDAPVARVGQLQRVVARHDPGESIRVRVIRFGETRTFDVRLMEAPLPDEPTRTAAAPDDGGGDDGIQGLGLQVAELNSRRAQEFGFRSTGGAVISDVEPMSPAHRKGVRAGERIVSINRTPIGSAEEAEALLQRLGPGEIASFVFEGRNGRTRIANVRVP